MKLVEINLIDHQMLRLMEGMEIFVIGHPDTQEMCVVEIVTRDH